MNKKKFKKRPKNAIEAKHLFDKGYSLWAISKMTGFSVGLLETFLGRKEHVRKQG